MKFIGFSRSLRPARSLAYALIAAAAAVTLGSPNVAWARIYVAESLVSTPQARVFTNSGTPFTSLSGFDPGTSVQGVALSGNNVFVGDFLGMIHRYTLDGSFVDIYPSGGTHIVDLAASASHVFAKFEDGHVGKYGLDGTPVNASFITGLPVGIPGIAVEGSRLLVPAAGGVLAEYNAGTGALVNPALITSSLNSFGAVAVSGSRLFVADVFTGEIGQYDAVTGAVIDPFLIDGVRAHGLAASGPRLWFSHIVDGLPIVSQYDVISGAFAHTPRSAGFFGTLLKQVAATPYGDLNDDNDLDAQDYLTLASNLHADVSAMTFDQAAALGDLTGDKIIDGNDFADFRLSYEVVHGPGSFVALLTALPEPDAWRMAIVAFISLAAARTRR